jgi:peptidyl-prolyl cis-trans isomerase D
MLSGIRNATRGWIAGGLLTLIAAAFVFWGIPQDILNFAAPNAVASGQGVTVDAQEYRQSFDRMMDRAREQAGGQSVSTQDAVDQGLDVAVLQQLVSQKALDKLADKMGIAASNAALAGELRGTQAFHSQITNQFDKDTYLRVLGQNNLTPAMYEDSLRGDLRRQQLAEAVATNQYTPKSYAKLIFTVETEQRAVSAALAPASLGGAPPTPTEADLTAFYNANKARYATPEYRALTLAIADPTIFAAKVEVPEDDIKKQYEYEKPKLAGGETRTFVQLSAPDQAVANEAARRLAAGEDPAKLAAALKVQAIPFNAVRKDQVPDAALAEAVFGLKEGQTTGAIKGKLAWAVAKVSKIEGGAAPSYESMRDQLRAQLAKDAAANALNDALDKFEEERSAGKSFEEAAQATGLSVIKHARVDAQGRDQGGAPIQGVADNANLLKAVAATSANETTEFTATADAGYVMARIDDVIPAGTRPFAEIKPALTLQWQSQKVGEQMRKVVDGFTAQVKAGKPFAEAARASKMQVVVSGTPFTRQAIGQTPLGPAAGQIFDAAKGDVVSAPAGNAILVAQVTDIIRPAPESQPALFEQARQLASQFLSQDLISSVQQRAVVEAKVKFNDKLRMQALGLGDPAQDGATSP